VKTSRRNVSILFIILVVLITVPFGIEAKADSDPHYTLSLAAKQRFSTVTLTAYLTSTVDHKEKNVAGAVIYFYTCDSHGDERREIGHNVTGRDGTTIWRWSATHNGVYWFIAGYYSKSNNDRDMVTS
jgi:hypothetical protein